MSLSTLHPDVVRAMNKFWMEFYPHTELPEELTQVQSALLLKRMELAPATKKYFPRARDGVLDSLRALVQGSQAVT